MKSKLQKFMIGRYGHDELNQAIFVVEIILFVITLFSKSVILNIIFSIVVILYIYRAFSKNIVARSLENQQYKKMTAKYRHMFKAMKLNRGDKNFKYFVCPKCAQIVRVPRNKGEIEIKCPACKSKFSKKS